MFWGHLAAANPQTVSGDAFSFTVSSFLRQWKSSNAVAIWEYTVLREVHTLTVVREPSSGL